MAAAAAMIPALSAASSSTSAVVDGIATIVAEVLKPRAPPPPAQVSATPIPAQGTMTYRQYRSLIRSQQRHEERMLRMVTDGQTAATAAGNPMAWIVGGTTLAASLYAWVVIAAENGDPNAKALLARVDPTTGNLPGWNLPNVGDINLSAVSPAAAITGAYQNAVMQPSVLSILTALSPELAIGRGIAKGAGFE